jgi:hypothetical protein
MTPWHAHLAARLAFVPRPVPLFALSVVYHVYGQLVSNVRVPRGETRAERRKKREQSVGDSAKRSVQSLVLHRRDLPLKFLNLAGQSLVVIPCLYRKL